VVNPRFTLVFAGFGHFSPFFSAGAHDSGADVVSYL
jgi:hypothetical protein